MSIIINLYGNGIRCWVCEIPKFRYEQLQMVADFNKTSFENIIFDLEILNNIGYSHWSKIFPIKEVNGFKVDARNKVEIKKGRRIVSKFSAENVLGNNTLFNLYNTEKVRLSLNLKKGYRYILIGQQEIGSIKYKIPMDNFLLEDLKFSIYNKIDQEENIVTIKYRNEILKPINDDTMVQSFFIRHMGFKGD